ncbi:MAG: methylmalonyl Co-A mutase-associated GTPase MeaB [candidate division Zixibacteria bacterium]|nr:methylmalonyl Co-A mutase-associated GTPase MeaB [candidate division Zixibacteria bacterium]
MNRAGAVTTTDFLERFLAGDRLALARAISAVEDEADGYRDFLRQIYGRAGKAYLIGITGPPGAGKSTLVSHLAERYAAAGQNVGVVAVDPTSPFTGGALLGDRIRMNELAGNERIFIRSMATRGSPGGLAKATGEVALTMDAFGFDTVLIETVGVGQSELDVANSADTTVVVVVPESGDAVQAMKAGLMEIADVLVVNKADREGAEPMARELRVTLELKPEDGWRPPIIMSVATEGRGIDDITDAVTAHRSHLEESGGLTSRRRSRVQRQLEELLAYEFRRVCAAARDYDNLLEFLTAEVQEGRLTPYEASARLFKEVSREM